MVIQYELESHYNAGKWDSLDVHLTQSDRQVNADWVAQKKRIQGVTCWGDLAGKQGISANGVAWHMRPVGLISIFCKGLKNSFPGELTYDAEGMTIPSSIYFSRQIDWPGNTLSGVILGRGYDIMARS
jgi:hypothetical protein